MNFGAPGDWRDEDGTRWFGYPHHPGNSFFTYSVDFALQEQFLPDMGYFSRNFQGPLFTGMDKPWVFASGCRGLSSCVLPLIGKGQAPGVYTVRLYFADTANVAPGRRVFDVKLQGETVLEDFDIVASAGETKTPACRAAGRVVREFKGIHVPDGLRVELIPKIENPSPEQAPLLNGIEVVREDTVVADGVV